MREAREDTSAVVSGLRGGIGRRRLLRAGLAAAPVILAVSGRSAMAAPCAPGLSEPTLRSLDPDGDGDCAFSSHQVYSYKLGLSPGYWKPNPNGQTFQGPYAWPVSPFVNIRSTTQQSFRWDPLRYLEYNSISADAEGWASGAKFRDIFTASADSRSFSRILLDDAGSLSWHFCAAYLNAAAMSAGSYVMSPEEVVFLATNGYSMPSGQSLTDGQIKAFLAQTWA